MGLRAEFGDPGPRWSPVDTEQADLLTLVADAGHVSADVEWGHFTAALIEVANVDGIVPANLLRQVVRGKVAPKRLGAFTHRALKAGILRWDGAWEVSDDREGKNAGKPCRVYRLVRQP